MIIVVSLREGHQKHALQRLYYAPSLLQLAHAAEVLMGQGALDDQNAVFLTIELPRRAAGLPYILYWHGGHALEIVFVAIRLVLRHAPTTRAESGRLCMHRICEDARQTIRSVHGFTDV